ncbi:condensation domain-containing protein [Rhodococcus sovatensis]|uniref:Condensation domain-containing protein n=1 Tax=Rhodococcus sovatensis TaxID=1805840 RepID=A0ABZ2PQC1_9NOCA
MRVTSITEFRTAPGTYLEWPVHLGAGEPSTIPPSFNQTFHLSSTLDASNEAVPTGAVWIATAFDVEGPLDVDALTWSFTTFIERHAALRTTFHASGGEIHRRVHGPHELRIGRPSATTITDSTRVSAHLRSRLNELCHPAQRPSYSFAAVDRPDRATVVCGFDHAHVDALSMTVAAEEITTLYQARRAGTVPELDSVGSFVEYCAAEAQAPEVASSDPRILAWSDFVDGCGGRTPAFPFDLGVALGDQAPQATTIHALATAEDAALFERLCRGLGAGVFSAIVAAAATAAAEMGGPQVFSLLFPLHTRRAAEYAHALGWFTTNAPMSVVVGDTFADTLTSAHTSFRAALPLAAVPIPHVLRALGEQFSRPRQDVFMISYIDYRTLPGADADDRNAHHISNVTTADDAQFWVSRTCDGLALRSRFPDTPQGHAIIESFALALAAVIRQEVGATAYSSEASLVGPNA